MSFRILSFHSGNLSSFEHVESLERAMNEIREGIVKDELSINDGIYLLDNSTGIIKLMTKEDIFPSPKPLTYRQLLRNLQELNDEQLDMSASILLEDEVIPIKDTCVAHSLVDAGFLGSAMLDNITDVVGPEQPLLIV
jgi:hypothetical protein